MTAHREASQIRIKDGFGLCNLCEFRPHLLPSLGFSCWPPHHLSENWKPEGGCLPQWTNFSILRFWTLLRSSDLVNLKRAKQPDSAGAEGKGFCFLCGSTDTWAAGPQCKDFANKQLVLWGGFLTRWLEHRTPSVNCKFHSYAVAPITKTWVTLRLRHATMLTIPAGIGGSCVLTSWGQHGFLGGRGERGRGGGRRLRNNEYYFSQEKGLRCACAHWGSLFFAFMNCSTNRKN